MVASSPGDLWLLIGAPGEGRSTLLTSIAGHLAREHRLQTYLVSTRDPARVVSGRLHANETGIPLGHILEYRLTSVAEERLSRCTHKLSALPLHLAAGPYARHRAADDLPSLARAEPIVAMFDDPDWETEWNLRDARHLADSGAAVVAALPRERLLYDTAAAS